MKNRKTETWRNSKKDEGAINICIYELGLSVLVTITIKYKVNHETIQHTFSNIEKAERCQS
jgi:hypothetical protein